MLCQTYRQAVLLILQDSAFPQTRYPFERDMERIKKETIGYIKLIFLSVNDQEQKEQDIYETITAYIRKNYNKKI